MDFTVTDRIAMAIHRALFVQGLRLSAQDAAVAAEAVELELADELDAAWRYEDLD